MTLPNIKTAAFAITGGTSSQSLDTRFGRALTPYDFNPTGLDLAGNSADAAPAIQAMFDAAFGSSASPHGLSNAALNRPCHIPAGRYKLQSTLTLTRVVGGWIYGDGLAATQLIYSGAWSTETPVLSVNGMASSLIRCMSFTNDVTKDSVGVDLDWDGTSGGDGLHNNCFTMCGLSGKYGLILAKSGLDGAGIQLTGPIGGGGSAGAAFDIRSDTAHLQVLHPSIGGYPILYKAHKGALIVQGGSGESSDVNFDIDGPNTRVTVIGNRTESTNVFRVAAGTLKAISINHAVTGTFAEIHGGKVILDACNLNAGGSLSQITGDAGALYMRGCFTNSGYRSGFSGTVTQDI
jgi:hypothetical protein